MIMKYDDLIDLLMKHSVSAERLPSEAFGIDFATDPFKAHDTITYHTAAGGILAIDVDKDGEVLSIEII